MWNRLAPWLSMRAGRGRDAAAAVHAAEGRSGPGRPDGQGSGEWEEWQPLSRRGRGLALVLGVATAAGVLLAMVQPQLRALRHQAETGATAAAAAPADGASAPVARSVNGADCVARPGEACAGGKLDVMVLPAPPR